MSEDSTNRAKWQATVEYTADVDPARARAVEDARERLARPKLVPAVVWHLPDPGAVKDSKPTGPYLVMLDGRVVAERTSLRGATVFALALKGSTVRQGRREWGREELRAL